MSVFVLSAARLSAAFQERVERIVGEVGEIVILAELRQLGSRRLLRRLRSLEGACVVVVEDPGATVLLPVLEALAAVTRATSIDVVRPDLTRSRVSRVGGLASLAGLAGSSVEGQRALRVARREVDKLLQAQRAPARAVGSNVLYLNANLWLGLKAGGSVAHVAGVANALQRSGRPVTLATAVDPIGIAPEIDVHRLETPRLAFPAESNYYRFGQSIPHQLRNVSRPSFLYQRHSVGSYAGAVTSRALGVPLVLEYNGPEVWAAQHWSRRLGDEQLAIRAEEASLRHAHVVVTVSQVLAEQLLERGVEPNRIVWHANGVDAALFDPARFTAAERAGLRDRYGIPHDALLVSFVGTFGEWHGAEVLARAVRLLAEEHADRVESARMHLLLVGDGPTLAEVRTELEGLERLVTFAGLVAQDETPLHLAASDVLVSPHVPNRDGSPFFGSPTKLFEYMASGQAIVASDLGQIGDVLRDGLAVLVRPGDADDLARGLRAVADDEELRRDIGVRARARVLERYTWDDNVRAVLAAVDAL